MIPVIEPDWPAPSGVFAFSTTRSGGASDGPWKSLNLGSNSGDSPVAVSKNRERLAGLLPSPVRWLSQVHGNLPVSHEEFDNGCCEADAIYTSQPGTVCAVLTADCLPVLFVDTAGKHVAAAHAGWRGLHAGVLARTVRALDCKPSSLMAWLGPGIGAEKYEVGDELRSTFMNRNAESELAFRRAGDAWLADLYLLAKQQLRESGVKQIYGGSLCTHSEPQRFFSYRRDGVTGRMATLIWLEKGARFTKPAAY